jgi:hypothetical protein
MKTVLAGLLSALIGIALTYMLMLGKGSQKAMDNCQEKLSYETCYMLIMR